MIDALAWILAIVLLALHPDFVFRHDRRNYDGDRVLVLCGGLYQRPATWACLELER